MGFLTDIFLFSKGLTLSNPFVTRWCYFAFFPRFLMGVKFSKKINVYIFQPNHIDSMQFFVLILNMYLVLCFRYIFIKKTKKYLSAARCWYSLCNLLPIILKLKWLIVPNLMLILYNYGRKYIILTLRSKMYL